VSAPAPSEPDALLARIAADQWGVVTLGDARRCGLSRKAVMVRVRKGLIYPLHRGVFALGHPAIPLEGKMLAAVKACGDGAALSHFACCAHWDFVNWDGREIEVIVSGSGTRVHAGIHVHRSELLPRSHLMTHRGIFCTSPARALIDMAADAPQEQVRGAIRRAMSLRRVSAQGLASALTRLGPRRGSAKVAKVLTAGYVPTRSELEDVVYELICKGGFVPPDVNVPLRIGRRTAAGAPVISGRLST